MKKKILFTIPNFDTAGSGKALLKIALGLDSKQFDPHIACLHDRGEYFQVVKASGIPVHVFPFVSPARPISSLFRSAWRVSKRLRVIQPDLIHSFHYNADYTEAFAATLAGIPWVFTKKSMSWGGASRNGWKIRSAFAKGIVVQNTDMLQLFYPKSKKTCYIHRGVDVKQFIPREVNPQIRRQMGTEEQHRIIVCVANLVPVKGIEVLINAFKKLAPDYPNWRIWLVGENDNEYGRELIHHLKEIGLQSRVHFAGKQQNVRAYLDHAEIFVLPTKDEGRREGSPVAILEAMANKKAVLGSAVPGIKDQLKNYPGHLFTAGSHQELVQKLKHLMDLDSRELQVIGNNFHQLVQEKFRIDQEVTKHEEFYVKLLSPSR